MSASRAELEHDLEYTFDDPQLLERALTHSSHAHEKASGGDSEQLEFLGDAVLGFLVSEALYRANPELTEGQLSKLKGFFVSSANLVNFGERLRLGRYLRLGKGEEKTGGRTKQALLVDAFEAVLGAMYLDGGIAPVTTLIQRLFQPQFSQVSAGMLEVPDFKSAMEQTLHSRHMGRAQFVVADASGPEQPELFVVEVVVGGRSLARGAGLTRQAAEQAAAGQVLKDLAGRRES